MKRLRMSLGVPCLTLFSCFSCLGSPALRVALLNAVCDDNSYRSTTAAVDFTAALQAQLSDLPDIEWVERADLEKVDAEFKLAGLGLIDRVEAIRAGRWVKANWAVLTRISTNRPGGRTFSLELVDLQRADLLAVTNATSAPRNETHFSILRGDVEQAEPALRSVLSNAIREQRNADRQKKVALLFLSGAEPVASDFEDQFRDAIESCASNDPPVHVVRFRRADLAMDEASLDLSGLAQIDLNAWEQVADIYIWGECSAPIHQSFDPQRRQWQEAREVAVKFNVWDGKSDSRVITIRDTNSLSSQASAHRFAVMVAPLLTRQHAQEPQDGARRRISGTLAARALEMARTFPNLLLETAAQRQAWMEIIRMIEAACFFDPANQMARELWVRARWGPMTAMASENEFFFARRRSEAWRKHVEQFGFQSVCPPPPSWNLWTSDSVSAEYVLSAWRPFEMFQYSQDNQAGWGAPRDAGGKELAEWHRQFAEELFERLLAAPQDPRISLKSRNLLYGALAMDGGAFVLRDPRQRQRVFEKLWPDILELQRQAPAEFDSLSRSALKRHFEQLGRRGAEQAYLAQLEKISLAREVELRSRPVQLPRASNFDHPQQPSQ